MVFNRFHLRDALRLSLRSTQYRTSRSFQVFFAETAKAIKAFKIGSRGLGLSAVAGILQHKAGTVPAAQVLANHHVPRARFRVRVVLHLPNR